LGVGVAVLGHDFERRFGLSIRAYHRILRVLAALEQVRTAKVDAVALEVGYRSKKNLYRALYQVTGLTPTGFRKLSATDAERLVNSLKLTLVDSGLRP
jgi:methylphosphotriester-DNA--protein-cysteine methyltransferase